MTAALSCRRRPRWRAAWSTIADGRGVIPGLRPGGHVWLVALADGDHDQIDFAPPRHHGLHEADRIFIRPGSEVAQIPRLDQAP
jgi:hypothetical protein